ncbi:MAG: hypothetical protein L0229_00860 [Blastocatellia bacterium]|nr:hypothetical protein [Blastocatellia bacterium]
MRKSLMLGIIFVLALPVLGSLFKSENSVDSTPFASVAYAGHTGPGEWCECGCPGCICDPEEQPISCQGNIVSQDKGSKGTDSTGDFSKKVSKSPGFDPGSGALLMALLFLMWRRMWF